MGWMENFVRSQIERRNGAGLAPEEIPFGPPLDERTDMHRPAYWMTDLSTYPNARFGLCYCEKDAVPAQRVHVLYPEGFRPGVDEPVPVLMFVHGGGFQGGNTENDGRTALYTAEGALHALDFGYAVALVDYRLLPEFSVLDAIYDVKAAIRYLRANAAELGLDGERIALTGESAGGYLVDIVGVTGDDPEFEDPEMGCAGISTKVTTVISWYSLCEISDSLVDIFYPGVKDPTLRAALRFFFNPINHVDASAPPFLLQHGTEDSEVEFRNSVMLYRRLCEATGEEEHCLEPVEGAEHAVRWFITRENGERMVRWLDQFMK